MQYVKLGHDFAKFLDESIYAGIIASNDETGVVLRLHLIAERFLDVYLSERIPENHRPFFPPGKSGRILRYFDEKLTTSVAYGLPIELALSLKRLNQVRNKFGHDLDMRLTDADVSEYVAASDNFKHVARVPYAAGEPISSVKVTVAGRHLSVNDGPKEAYVIATYCLITRAALWLVEDLLARGQLKIG